MPAGVVIASATQSGMLCVTRMNSIVNGPTVTVSRGLTVLSRSPASMPCSSSFGSTSASVIAVPYTGPSNERHHMRHGADVILVAVGEDQRLDLAAARLDVRHVGDDQIDAELVGVGEHDTGVDEDRGVLPGHGHHVHAELAEASQRRRPRASPATRPVQRTDSFGAQLRRRFDCSHASQLTLAGPGAAGNQAAGSA